MRNLFIYDNLDNPDDRRSLFCDVYSGAIFSKERPEQGQAFSRFLAGVSTDHSRDYLLQSHEVIFDACASDTVLPKLISAIYFSSLVKIFTTITLPLTLLGFSTLNC